MEEEGGRLSLLFTAAPVLRESTAAGGYNVKESRLRQEQKYIQNSYCVKEMLNIAEHRSTYKISTFTTSTVAVGNHNNSVSTMKQR